MTATGDKYEGEFKNSLKNGKGTEVYHNGDRYVGEYKDGKPYGQGEYNWEQGASYKGSFRHLMIYYLMREQKYCYLSQ